MLCLEAVNSTGYIRHKDSETDYVALNSGMVCDTVPIAVLGGL